MIIIHDVEEATYRPRAMAAAVERALRSHPVVVLTGARQTGKTTLVQHLAGSQLRSFMSLDDLDMLELAKERPQELLGMADAMTIDEVQRAPEVLLAIKRDVDKRRRPGRFLLTGSANLLLMRQVSDSLAGRAVYLHLAPMTAGEKQGRGELPAWSDLLASDDISRLEARMKALRPQAADWLAEALRGGMPVPALSGSREERSAWFDGYVRTYLERDLRDISQIASLIDFRRLMSLAVHRIGQMLNQTELGRDAGLAQATTHRYLNLLEVTFHLTRLTPYSVNVSRRLIKTPKLYWLDTGLAAHLAGIRTVASLKRSALVGALAENLVITSLLAWRELGQADAQVCYWRTAGGAEVDLVIEHEERVLPIEIKLRKQLRLKDVRHLESFLDEYGQQRAPHGIVLHETAHPHRVTARILALPIGWFV